MMGTLGCLDRRSDALRPSTSGYHAPVHAASRRERYRKHKLAARAWLVHAGDVLNAARFTDEPF
jgi:hypothetical protein